MGSPVSQIRNGLRVSGFLDSRTYSALNVSAQERLKQLETNFARVKSMLNFNKAPRYILVNVPAFTLQAIDQRQSRPHQQCGRRQADASNTDGVGEDRRSDFYPTWTVPESIARADLMPKLQKDPRLLRQRAFQRDGEGRLGRSARASTGASRRSSTTASSRTQAALMRLAWCASTCRTSTASICTTRR